ncbi:GPO family capsid scaffolding protein [Luteibacter mycovicinus]|uniref:GPO family capsid scaffolding protein n=1 Tax=Luteibacter mycovicinus TaxID=1500890 RepID=UPI00068F9291|nr:GPO family capsid scaffolding protein [Luteibacter sp. 9143a]
MADKTKKSKKFRIATEGATVDGRTIERDWIQQMAASYDPAKYTATINIEHIRGTLPDGPFRAFGQVASLSQEDNAAGKAELFAVLNPTDDLVAMTKKGQKVFTSIEVNPKFADTGKAYLVGLAVTDNPASLGTEMLAFSAGNPAVSPLTARKQHADNYFSVAIEVDIEFEDEPAAVGEGFLSRFRSILSRKAATDDGRFNALEQAMTEVAEHGSAQSTQTAKQFQTVDEKTEALTKRIQDLESKFDAAPGKTVERPRADGPATVVTDC